MEIALYIALFIFLLLIPTIYQCYRRPPCNLFRGRTTQGEPGTMEPITNEVDDAPALVPVPLEVFSDILAPGIARPPASAPFEMIAVQQPTAAHKKVCTVCLEDVWERQAVMLSCGHRFHKDCIESWLTKAKVASCPVCQMPVARAEEGMVLILAPCSWALLRKSADKRESAAKRCNSSAKRI